ncbi:MAG: phosphate ABC transporter permease PstA [Phycisphaerales bacterium]
MRTTESIIRRSRWQDRLFMVIGWVVVVLVLGSLGILLADIFIDGLGRIDKQFLTSFPSRRPGEAGVLSAWVGTALVMLVTCVAALPLGVAAGVYLEEYAPENWLTSIIEINITNLAGVPSIIYGLMALGLFVYAFGFGQSILSAGLTLGILILPIIIVATREALRGIPQHIREAAYGLGATRWQVVRHHLLPYSIGGIATGAIIGVSRAIGETAPLITIGALTFIAFLPPAPIQTEPELALRPFAWLSSPFTVLPIQMFNWVSRPGDAFLENAAAAGVILIMVTLVLNSAAVIVRARSRRRIKW